MPGNQSKEVGEVGNREEKFRNDDMLVREDGFSPAGREDGSLSPAGNHLISNQNIPLGDWEARVYRCLFVIAG